MNVRVFLNNGRELSIEFSTMETANGWVFLKNSKGELESAISAHNVTHLQFWEAAKVEAIGSDPTLMSTSGEIDNSKLTNTSETKLNEQK